MRYQLLKCLRELRQLNIDKLQLVVEDITMLVFQLNRMDDSLFILVVIENEVENANRLFPRDAQCVHHKGSEALLLVHFRN